MNNRVKSRIISGFLILIGIISKSLEFALAKTEEQLEQIAASFSIPDALIVIGVLLLIISFLIKK